MTTIVTHEPDGGYFDEVPGGRLGQRLHADRRLWLAWACTGRVMEGDCNPGVIDDFGSLVPVPDPEPESQH